MSTLTNTKRVVFDPAAIRKRFPSLAIQLHGRDVVFFDNPGGTQVTQSCIDAITAYLTSSNANTHGAFLTSQRTDEVLSAARAAMADLLNATDPREIVFGPNMTTLTFALSRAIGRTLKRGDEIVVTALDHDANVAPWLALEEERGIVVRVSDVDLTTCTLNMDDLRAKITERTKLVAVGYASNAVGTINDVATIIRWAHEVGALAFVDAVQFAPHAPIDVLTLDCDFLACSAYKFFATHQGVLYGKLSHLESLPSYKVRPADNQPPGKWETGTQNHECLAGLIGTLDYLAWVGQTYGEAYSGMVSGMTGRRRNLHTAMAAIQAYERGLAWHLITGLKTLPSTHLYGLTAEEDLDHRVPTVAITIARHTPRELAAALGERGIFAWDGNYYALTLMERLNLEKTGGALRIGLAHYNTVEEIDRTIKALQELIGV